MDVIRLEASVNNGLLLRVIGQTPEFTEIDAEQLAERLAQPDPLALIAFDGEEPVGYKIGYRRWTDGSWYSWLGAVLPEHRGRGIAQRLLTEQERWVAAQGYRSIRVKTRNRFIAMRILLARNGYELIELRRDGLARPDYRLLFEKCLEGSPAARG